MRRHGLSYFTPSHQRPHRDGEEIWAEAAASLWAGGLRINSAQTFARSTELCAMFAKFLDGQDPAHIRYDEFLKAQLTWLKNSEGRCLHGADQENRDDVFRRRNKSHGTKIKDASPRIQLMKDMRNARVETCDRGIRYRDKYLSPLNVVLTLTSELLRTSHALSDIGEIATLWGRYMARVPQPHCSEPGERSRKAAIKFGTKVLLMQMEPLTRIERARLLKTLRKHAFGQSWSKQMLFLDMLHETAVKLRAKNRDQKQKCVRPSEKGAAEKGEFEYELAAASPAARLLGPR